MMKIKDEECFHIDYYTVDGRVMHDKNKYQGIKTAIKQINTQIDDVISKAPIRKITIMTWKEAEEIAKRNKKRDD